MRKYSMLDVQVRAPTPGVPLVAFTLKPEKRTHGYNEFDIADRLRQFGWVVPVRAQTFAHTNLLSATTSSTSPTACANLTGWFRCVQVKG